MIFETKNTEGVQITIDANAIKVKGKKGENERKFNPKLLKIKNENNKIIVETQNKLTKTNAYAGSINAHIKNMIKGVNEGFTYKMKIVFAHFPINASVQGNTFLIKNFEGEKIARTAKIIDGIKVEIKGQEVILNGIDREKVAQSAANIEKATKVRKKDVRVFNDGIFITDKGD